MKKVPDSHASLSFNSKFDFDSSHHNLGAHITRTRRWGRLSQFPDILYRNGSENGENKEPESDPKTSKFVLFSGATRFMLVTTDTFDI